MTFFAFSLGLFRIFLKVKKVSSTYSISTVHILPFGGETVKHGVFTGTILHTDLLCWTRSDLVQ